MPALDPALPVSILDILPNPVLIKDENLEYVWINRAFEKLFNVKREDVIGRRDKELFPDRQVAQCNGGDMRVLGTGVVDEAVETVFKCDGEKREMITRKSRLVTDKDGVYLVGSMHDITDVTRANLTLEATRLSLIEQAKQLETLASTDALTGCYNRRAFDQCERDLFSSEHNSSALLLMDIDFFKKINDNHGHDCGDSVLRHFSTLVRTVLGDDDYFIRLGGEEFAICCRSDSSALAIEYADSIRKLIEDTPFIYNGRQVPFTVSIGVATKAKRDRVSIDAMLLSADVSLYNAKSSGRNKVMLVA